MLKKALAINQRKITRRIREGGKRMLISEEHNF
jgi:hypothetical protein